MKPYSVQAQVLGSLVVLTLCRSARKMNPAQCLGLLAEGLRALPAATEALVLDLGHAPTASSPDALALVHAWAKDRSVYLVTVGKAAAKLRFVPGPARSARADGLTDDDTGGDGLRRALAARALGQRAEGIYLARRRDGHPCSAS
ncbi:hypothetical protein ACWDYJ_07155 [Streptomyces sp. NPDC003042]